MAFKAIIFSKQQIIIFRTDRYRLRIRSFNDHFTALFIAVYFYNFTVFDIRKVDIGIFDSQAERNSIFLSLPLRRINHGRLFLLIDIDRTILI